MSTYKELRQISLDFRRLSSNFLNSTDQNASVLIQRFRAYIDNSPFVAELIHKTIDGVEYNYLDCFVPRAHGGWNGVNPPVDEACHIKAMYDYLCVIVDNNANVFSEAMHYPHSEKKIDDIIKRFLVTSFKPLVDFINDSISKEMIMLNEEKLPSMTQNIGRVYGTVNQQGSGTINSTNYTNSSNVNDIVDLLEKIMPSLEAMTDIPNEVIEDVKDDLQSVEEQMKSSSPKKNRLQKAIAGVKKFFGDFSMKMALTAATSIATSTDWSALISKVEEFIASL